MGPYLHKNPPQYLSTMPLYTWAHLWYNAIRKVKQRQCMRVGPPIHLHRWLQHLHNGLCPHRRDIIPLRTIVFKSFFPKVDRSTFVCLSKATTPCRFYNLHGVFFSIQFERKSYHDSENQDHSLPRAPDISSGGRS